MVCRNSLVCLLVLIRARVRVSVRGRVRVSVRVMVRVGIRVRVSFKNMV